MGEGGKGGTGRADGKELPERAARREKATRREWATKREWATSWERAIRLERAYRDGYKKGQCD